MSLLKSIFSTIVVGIKDIPADLKELLTKAQPILVDIATDATDLLNGTLPPPSGSKALDDFFKVLLILVPYYKGNKTALEAAIAEVVSFIEGAIAIL